MVTPLSLESNSALAITGCLSVEREQKADENSLSKGGVFSNGKKVGEESC